MARIPTGNFGSVVAEGQRRGDTTAIGRGIEQVGQAVSAVAQEVQQRRETEARSKAANEVLDHELQIKTQAEEISEQVATGDLSPDDATAAFDKATGAYKAPQIDYLDPVAAEGLERGRQRTVAASRSQIGRVVDSARRRDGQARFTSSLDTLGKLAALPDSNVEEINTRAEQLREMARQAGIPDDQVTVALQNFKDSNWYNHAVSRSMNARNDMAGLKGLAKDLTAADGFYAGKLDTDRRNAILRGVQGDQDRLINHAETQQLRAEARADRALAQVDRQIASGVPATPQMWAEWSAQVKGTPAAAEFRERVKSEQLVQEVLRQPIEKQEAFVQQQEAQLLQNGGTVQQAANVERLKAAVKRNVTLMQQAPLLFQQNRTGADVEPVDFMSLATDEGSAAVRSNLRDRVLTLDAMRRQYGDRVPMRPLLPQEAQQLSAAIEGSSARQSAQVFAQLRDAVGDDQTFIGMMAQIAPDSPVKAAAAILASKQRNITLDRKWIGDDVVASSRDVASTILAGEDILNRTKAGKGTDGKPDKGLFMPSDQDLQDKFKTAVGTAFAGRPGAADIAFQMVKSYYAGKAAQTGRIAATPQDVDTNIVREAITGALGSVVDYKGRGEVLAPWGMREDEFDDSVRTALELEASRSANPEAFRERAQLLGLQQSDKGEGSYYLTNGRGYVTDAQGQPIVIDVVNPGSAQRSGKIQR